jgi:hypothetical protein
MSNTITVQNPWSKAIHHVDVTDMTQNRLDALVMLMDDDIREELCYEGHATPGAFFAAYADRVGMEAAGAIWHA